MPFARLRRWLPWATAILSFTLASPALGLVVGVNIDVHQDIMGPIMPNDFHIEGRIESGRPAGEPGGGGWSQPPVLIEHIDDQFLFFNYTISPDLSEPSENWYVFRADWRLPPGPGGIPFCTILHLGVFFDATCHNIVIDLVGWWTRNGVPIGIGTNGGFVPLIGFEVDDDLIDRQFLRLRNDSGGPAGTGPPIYGDVVHMDVVALSREEVQSMGPNPFEELNVDGAQQFLPWAPVLRFGMPVSEFNPMPFPPFNSFQMFLDGGNPDLAPAEPIFIQPGGFLLSRQLLRFEGNSGSQEYRWYWEIHGAHPPPPPPPPPPPLAGINVDIHQDNLGGANDFHVEGRIESGPFGGNWSNPPVLVDMINDLFPFWNISITPDFGDPGQNWYNFSADWFGAEIPFCSVLHLGLFFSTNADPNVIIDLVGWWTRDGQRVGGGFNLGYVPMLGFDVAQDMLGRGQRIRIQNGDMDATGEPGEVYATVVGMDLALIMPGQLETMLGPAPFRELRLGGMQEMLPWVPVEVNGIPVSEMNPLPAPPDSFFDVFFQMPQPGQPGVPFPFTVEPEGFLVARERVRFVDNSGNPDFRWFWDIHGATTGPQQPRHDLGDAPDSSNSFGFPPPMPLMTAYPPGGPPGVLADFPTVYQIGSPPFGPIHLQPRAFAWLGAQVTLEQEADVGPDQDGINNLLPSNDLPDLDIGDDGMMGMPLVLPHCRPTTIDYVVTVLGPGPVAPLYVNVWFDWNRNGDWDDTMTCQDLTLTSEWAVQNQQLMLGIGVHTVTTPVFLPWHPVATVEPPPIWMRITLAERAYDPIPAQGYGGAGPPGGYEYGETEDYYFWPQVPPAEACCLPSGECQNLPHDECLRMLGTPQGPDTSCRGVTEACCIPSPIEPGMTCLDVDPICCDDMGGIHQGPFTQCSVEEACCLPDGSCIMVDPICCDEMGGIPQGPGTACTQRQACCAPSPLEPGIVCLDVDPLCCDEYGGTPQGAGTACVDLVASCCLPDGSCVMVDPICCDELGGHRGFVDTCLGDANGNGTDDACEPPTVACCMPDAGCEDLDWMTCVNRGGDPQGPGIQCNALPTACWPLKWSQPPVFNLASPGPPDCFWGWDVFSHYQCCQIVADDWLCTGPRPITDVHWWGSYQGWTEPVPPPFGPDLFHVGIWTNVPAGIEPFSHPGTMIWEWIVPRAALGERPMGCNWHPDHYPPAQPGDACFRYDFHIPVNQWFYQPPTPIENIYWVSISAIYQGPPPPVAVWGWKTRPHFFADDAVVILDPVAPRPGDSFRFGYPIADSAGNTWDMAFVLTTGPPPAEIVSVTTVKAHGSMPPMMVCPLPVTGTVPNETSDPRRDRMNTARGITEIDVKFDQALDPSAFGLNGAAVSIEETTTAMYPAWQAYSGTSVVTTGGSDDTLILYFTPGLEHARTYRMTMTALVTSAPTQRYDVRGLIGDVNSDGMVNAIDRSVVVGVWTGAGFSCNTDVNTDGITNATDRSIIVGVWTSGNNTAP